MKKGSWWTMVLVLVALLCLAGWTSSANTSSKMSWEYKVISIYSFATNPAPDVQHLNNAGAEGWELIAIRSGDFQQAGSHQVRTDYYFKR